MKKLTLILSFILLINADIIFSQEVEDCATRIPEGVSLEQAQSENLTLYKRTTTTPPLRLAVHIIRSSSGSGGISEADLQEKIEYLNYYMGQAYFEFYEYTRDYIDSDYFFTINNEQKIIQLLQVNSKNACINVYFVPNFSGYNGVARFSPRLNNTGIHGIIVRNGAPVSTLPHEMGHFFDLFHTHETYFNPTGIFENIARTGSCANWDYTGDLLQDTPADPSSRVTFSCIDNDCNWNPAKPLPPDGCGQTNYNPLTNNLMITELPQCRTTFTQQQKNRMNETLILYRPELLENVIYLENRIGSSNAGNKLWVNQIEYNSGELAPLPDGNFHIKTNLERFTNYQGSGFTYKHNNWNLIKNDFFLGRNVQVSGSVEQISYFEKINYAKIQVAIEGIIMQGKGYAYFRDPWYVLSDGSQPGNHWHQFFSEYEPNGKAGATEKGVFLNQELKPNIPHYKLWSGDQLINLGAGLGVKNFYFQNWSSSQNAILEHYGAGNEAGVVFTDPNAIVQANFKGQGISNQTNAYSSNSQRKVARTSDGALHMVYSSMGKIWYEKSTNNGVNWLVPTLIAENSYESEGAYCRNPAIAAYGNRVGIVYQIDGIEPYVPTKLFAREIINGNLQPEEDIESYFSIPNINPAVSYSNETFAVAWKPSSSQGLLLKMKVFNNHNSQWEWQATTNVPNTNANSSNPSIFHSGHYQGVNPNYNTHILAWQQYYYETMNGPDIRIRVYDNLHFISNYFFYGYNADISTGGGFATNQNPSVTVVGGYPMVSWTGINQSQIMEKNDGSESITTKKTVVRGKTSSGWSSTFFTVGDNVEFSNIMGRDNPSISDAIVSWSENNGQQAKFIKRSNGTFQCASLLSSNGIETQLSPSSTFSAMKAYVFNNSGNPPYAIVRANNDFNTDVACGRELKKTGNEDDDFELTFGRSGIIVKNDLQFVFNIGDIQLNNEPVFFIERSDTLPVNSVAELNSILKTEPFYLDGNSSLLFSNYFYVLNKEYADSLLGEDDFVSFRSELVKVSTGQVVGTFNTVNYNKTNLTANGHRNYEINCSGIEGGMYYFRLTAQTEGEVLYFVANVQSDASVLEKRHYASINYDGNIQPEEYALSQNYPNPFNPATIISYQITADGFVTLKVYDILGKEVATLVNEQQKTGRYNVNFNASHLSSGVYIYELRSGDFIQGKKMMLLR